MTIATSVLAELLQVLPSLRPQMYFKSSLTALSHAMEDLLLAGSEQPLAIASLQKERFYRQEAHRYGRIAQKTSQLYVLCAPETDFANGSGIYETIAFTPQDPLAQEWHLVVLSHQYAGCLICREKALPPEKIPAVLPKNKVADNSRRFEGIWTFDRQVTETAANILLNRILVYRPELEEKIEQAKRQYLQQPTVEEQNQIFNSPLGSADPFVERLVAYLQAGQYKLIKANRSLIAKEEKERLLNSVIGAIRRSLDPDKILQVAVQRLGEGLGVCRCLVYRCEATNPTATIDHEFVSPGISSIKGRTWPLGQNPLFKEVVEFRESLSIENTFTDPRINSIDSDNNSLPSLVKSCSIFSWMLVPVIYQDRLLGMVELHHCGPETSPWKPEDIALVDAVATQIGVALIQAEAYANLQYLNQQLEALDRTRSNLVAITGHELRTPLSTIQVCLESLASEPDMEPAMRQIMLDTALNDAERMRTLIQDFLILSELESGRVQWHLEPLSLNECIELAVSNIRARYFQKKLPEIRLEVSEQLPLVQGDGEWLVELLVKLLDNSCKFTPESGWVRVTVDRSGSDHLQVALADNGRGIESDRLEKVFDRFYQEEGALRRSVGGTGLGLAICRQIVKGWGGDIWAESSGKDRGSEFYFTLPLVFD